MNYSKIMKIVLGMPKTIILNFKLLPIKQAIRLPIVVGPKTKLCSLKGKIILSERVTPAMVQIGISGGGTELPLPTMLECNGTISFLGKANIGGGCQISVGKCGNLVIGNGTSFTGEAHIYCRKRIEIGSDCLISWDTQIMDTDVHKIYSKDNQRINEDADIYIGNHSWIGSRVNILKGTNVANNTIIASDATIKGIISEESCIITGLPTRVIKSQCTWEA